MELEKETKENSTNGSIYSPLKKIIISGIVMAIYIVIMYLTQVFASGQYQIRIATSLYALGGLFPFLIVPMGIANLLSNVLVGGLGLPDMIGGGIVGVLTTATSFLIRKYKFSDWLVSLPVIFVPGLLVPIWLSYLIGVPYKVLAVSLCLGQVIPGIVGVLLLKQLQKVLK